MFWLYLQFKGYKSKIFCIIKNYPLFLFGQKKSSMVNILVLEGDSADLAAIRSELKKFTKSYVLKTAGSKSSFEKLFVEFSPQVVLAEYSLPEYNGLQAFHFCKSLGYEGVFFLLSESLSEETLVDFLNLGIDDYFIKPNLKRLPEALKNALERLELHQLKEKSVQKLNEQSKLLKDLFESCFEATLISRDGIIKDCNPTFSDIFGYSKNDIVGKSVFSFCHPEFIDIAKHHVLNNTRDCYVLKFFNKTGEVVTAEVMGRPIVMDGVTQRITSFRDKTKLEVLEENLSMPNEKFEKQQKMLLNLVRDTHSNVENSIRRILQTDAQLLNVERVSLWMYNSEKQWLQCRLLYRLSENKFEGGPVILKEDHPVYFKFIEEHRHIAANNAQTDERTLEFTENYLKPNGIGSMLDIPIWVHGRHLGIVCHEHIGSIRNWTKEEIALGDNLADIMAGALCAEEQEKTLKRLLKSEIKLSDSQKVAGIGDWEFDAETKTLICSPETYRIHGRQPKIGRISLYEYSRLIHTDDRKEFNEMLDQVLESQISHRLAYRVLLPDGKSRLVHVNVKTIKFGEDTKIYGTMLALNNKQEQVS